MSFLSHDSFQVRGLEEARLDEAAMLLELLPGDEDAAEPPEFGGEAPDGMRRPAAATDSSRCFFLACNKEDRGSQSACSFGFIQSGLKAR